MKRYLLSISMILIFTLSSLSQVTTLAPNYKVIDIGWDVYGDYTKSLILLHEIYNGTRINKNYAIGTIQAMRGNSSSGDRIDIAQINSSSAYESTNGCINSFSNWGLKWTLKTAMYKGKKYLALEIPYGDAFHDLGFKFIGWTFSTSENMRCVSYEVNGQPVNQDILSNIQDFTPTMSESHDVTLFKVNGLLNVGNIGDNSEIQINAANGKSASIGVQDDDDQGFYVSTNGSYRLNVNQNGNVGIGINNATYKLDVNGTIHAREVKVDLTGWSDFVFQPTYKLKPLIEVEKYIKANGHLEDIPSAKEVEKNGVNMGEMQAKLLQKIEELTLYVIEKDKEIDALKAEKDKQFDQQQKLLVELKKEIENLKNK